MVEEKREDIERVVLAGGGEHSPLEEEPTAVTPWTGVDLARFMASMLWPVASKGLPQEEKHAEKARAWVEQYAQSVGPIWDALGAPELFFAGGELPKPVRALLIAGSGVLGLVTIWPRRRKEKQEQQEETT